MICGRREDKTAERHTSEHLGRAERLIKYHVMVHKCAYYCMLRRSSCCAKTLIPKDLSRKQERTSLALWVLSNLDRSLGAPVVAHTKFHT